MKLELYPAHLCHRLHAAQNKVVYMCITRTVLSIKQYKQRDSKCVDFANIHAVKFKIFRLKLYIGELATNVYKICIIWLYIEIFHKSKRYMISCCSSLPPETYLLTTISVQLGFIRVIYNIYIQSNPHITNNM